MKKYVKRLICIIMMAVMMVMLGACGEGQQTKTCTVVQNGVEMEIIIEANNDIINKWTQTSTVSIEGLDDATIAVLESLLEEMINTYAKYDKVSYEVKKTDSELTEVLTIDMSDSETVKSLVEEDLLPVEGNASRLSLKATVKGLEEQGWTVE